MKNGEDICKNSLNWSKMNENDSEWLKVLGGLGNDSVAARW
jgi:hypothetical protein